ncbi:hypothetical protein ACP70R_035840 [Stipagrostis hirtigluma subsp. patula]
MAVVQGSTHSKIERRCYGGSFQYAEKKICPWPPLARWNRRGLQQVKHGVGVEEIVNYILQAWEIATGSKRRYGRVGVLFILAVELMHSACIKHPLVSA